MKYLFLLAGIAIILTSYGQNKSIHQLQNEYYSALGEKPATYWDSLNGYKPLDIHNQKTCNLNHVVFGWHPYWSGTAYTNYHWDLLSHLTFFCYEVDPATGNATNTHYFATDPVIDAALANNVRVQLCVVLFSDHATFFGSASAKQTLIDNLISLVQSRGIHGVNIDFESVASSQKTNLTNFMIDLCNQMHTAVPGSEVSICLPAVDWSATFDVAAMNNYIDQFCIMGYDYYYGGSGTAGPTSPTYNFSSGYQYNISRSITYYLNKNVTPSKLVLGLPYYSFDYATSSSSVPSSTTASGSTRTFKTVLDNSSGYYTQANKSWSSDSYVPYYIYNNGSWHQCHIDDDYSFGKKLDVVLKRNIGGIGIWALGYDDGYQQFWDKLQEKLTDCYYTPCQDTIFDMGGPNWNYFDNEQYTYTLAPQNATSLTLNFSEFDLETNYDTLWLYDGPNTSSPLIGSFTGTNSPGTVSSTGGQMTLKFKSDGATTNPGYYATLQCATDNIDPTTSVSSGSTWKTQDFSVSFTDNDNTQIENRFFQVLDYNGTEWRANGSHGFFNDNFAQTLNSGWTTVTGTWSVSNGHLLQNDETPTNTNIYALVDQNSSYKYLYHFQINIDGVASNKRAGFHFFCDVPDSSNRNNSYFIWLRHGTTPYIEFYKVTNNVFSMKAFVSYPFTAATWYDVKVSYDPVSGLADIYINDEKVLSWTDSTPLQSGIAISPRTGNSITMFDDIKVYRSRTASETVTIGNSSAMVRYQNQNPSTPSCRIKSVVTDINHNIGTGSTDINIDWTPPSVPGTVYDGPTSDIDTTWTLTQLQANWSNTAIDPHSGVAAYWYAIGTTIGGTDVVNWVSNAGANYMNQTGLSLTDQQIYFVSVKSENWAGLFSNPVSSNGQVAALPVSIKILNNSENVSVYPNPVNNELNVRCNEGIASLKICDLSGRIMLKNIALNINSLTLDISSLAEGCYILYVNEKYSANIVKTKN